MKYHIIVSIFIFLFLNACNPDSNTNQNNSKKGLLKIEKIPNKQIKNKLLDDLKNLIETANEDRKNMKKIRRRTFKPIWNINFQRNLLGSII